MSMQHVYGICMCIQSIVHVRVLNAPSQCLEKHDDQEHKAALEDFSRDMMLLVPPE